MVRQGNKDICTCTCACVYACACVAGNANTWNLSPCVYVRDYGSNLRLRIKNN